MMKLRITNRMQYSISVSDIYAVSAGQTLEIEVDSIPKQLHHAASEGYVFYSVIPEESPKEISETTQGSTKRKRNKSKEIEKSASNTDESQEGSE